jgi:hypothetical protein
VVLAGLPHGSRTFPQSALRDNAGELQESYGRATRPPLASPAATRSSGTASSFVTVLEDDNSRLSCTQYDVYVALLSFADSVGMARPSHKAIRQRMRIPRDRRTVMRALRALEEMGKLEVWRGRGPEGTNVYIFMAVTAAIAATPQEGGCPSMHRNRVMGGRRLQAEQRARQRRLREWRERMEAA